MLLPALQRARIQLAYGTRVGVGIVPLRGPHEEVVLAHPPGDFVNLSRSRAFEPLTYSLIYKQTLVSST